MPYRVLKNHAIQAISAIEYARVKKKRLYFSINTSNADPAILKSIRALFSLNPESVLLEWQWLSHDNFLTLVATQDLSMQVSFNESFNICSADAVSRMVPIVVSKEISWASKLSMVDPTSVEDIVRGMDRALTWTTALPKRNLYLLNSFSYKSKKIWLSFLA